MVQNLTYLGCGDYFIPPDFPILTFEKGQICTNGGSLFERE